MVVLTDAQWAMLEPLVEACRPHAKVPPSDLRRTVEAILWRCTNGAKWRAVPEELGPWGEAAQIFIPLARLGVWDRLLNLAQERGVELGMAFLDGTNIRAHAKAAGASKKGDLAQAAEKVRRLGDLAAALAPRPSWSPTRAAEPSPSGSRRGRRTSCPMPSPARPPAGCAALGGRGSGLLFSHIPRPCLVQWRATCHPGQAQRSARGLPGLGLREPKRRRAALGTAERVAGGGNALRENRLLLHGRPLPRRQHGLDQTLTGPRRPH